MTACALLTSRHACCVIAEQRRFVSTGRSTAVVSQHKRKDQHKMIAFCSFLHDP